MSLQLLQRSDGTYLAAIPEGQIDDSSTTLVLPGAGVIVTAVLTNRNLVWMLENFSGSRQPRAPMKGQLWYDSTVNALKVWDGTAWSVPGGRLETPRAIAVSGVATGSVSFDGSVPVSLSATLTTTGPAAGTYTKITVNAQGMVTAASSVTASDIQSALGYVPASTADIPVTSSTIPLYGIIWWVDLQESFPVGYAACDGSVVSGVQTPNLTAYATANAAYIMRVF